MRVKLHISNQDPIIVDVDEIEIIRDELKITESRTSLTKRVSHES